MPREARVVVIGLPHHITQRGNARQDVFTTDSMRRAYLQLLSEHAAGNGLRLLAYCLMTNHVHIVAVPEADSSLANSLWHAHGRFSQYWNTEQNRTGHLWQNRYYSCPVEESAAGRVMAYVENNPVRAGMVERAEDFAWSSAGAHLGRVSAWAMLDMEWWQRRWTAERPLGSTVHFWIRREAGAQIASSVGWANERGGGSLRRSIGILECGVRMRRA